MIFVAICAAACLLTSGCLGSADAQSPFGVEVEVEVEAIKLAAKAEEAHKVAHTKAVKAAADVEDLALTIKWARFARLNKWAQDKRWVVGSLPDGAVGNLQIRSWWEEWRKLKVELEPEPEPKVKLEPAL